jgi:hypothetical protein
MLHRALGQAKNYSSEELVRAMELLLNCNQKLVSSGLDDTLLLQHTLVQSTGTAKLSSGVARRPSVMAA